MIRKWIATQQEVDPRITLVVAAIVAGFFFYTIYRVFNSKNRQLYERISALPLENEVRGE